MSNGRRLNAADLKKNKIPIQFMGLMEIMIFGLYLTIFKKKCMIY